MCYTYFIYAADRVWGQGGYSMGFSSFHAMFTVVPILIAITSVIILISIGITVVRGVGQWNRNNASPVLTVEARVIAKRADMSVQHQPNANQMNTTHSTTRYFITFEVESGDRIEFLIPDMEYGLLVEGDRGKLTFQGTRYLSFVRG